MVAKRGRNCGIPWKQQIVSFFNRMLFSFSNLNRPLLLMEVIRQKRARKGQKGLCLVERYNEIVILAINKWLLYYNTTVLLLCSLYTGEHSS